MFAGYRGVQAGCLVRYRVAGGQQIRSGSILKGFESQVQGNKAGNKYCIQGMIFNFLGK